MEPTLLASLLAVFVAVALPFWLSALALMIHQTWDGLRDRGRVLDHAAGVWLEATVRREAPDVSVQVHGQPGLDAYWPGVGAIGLSRRTYEGRDVVARAIAAHELGHAVNLRAHPLLADVLPSARLVEGLAWRGFGASLLVAALLGLGPAVFPAAAFAVLAAVAGLVVVLDEGMASVRAEHWLGEGSGLTAADRRVAGISLRFAWSVYATRLVGQWVVVAMLPWVLPLAVAVREVGPARSMDAIGGWILVVALPFLALRAMQVLVQVCRPEPVASDFRLFTVMQREAQWESLSGLAVLAVLFALHTTAEGVLFAVCAAFAALVALGPVAQVGRALLLLPPMLLLRRWTSRRLEDDEAMFGEVRAEGPAPALMVLYSDPPWYLRVSWLTQLAWLPMVVLLTVQALG